MEEKLVWIKGYEGKYKVSNFGYILRISNTYETFFKNKKIIRNLPQKILGGTKLSKKGYPRVNLNGKCFFIHRIVAEHFLINNENFPQINHIDGNKLNNNVNNLEWVTNQKNRDHAVKNKLICYGEKSPHAKLKLIDVKNIKTIYKQNLLTIKELAIRYNVNPRTIQNIIESKTWNLALKD